MAIKETMTVKELTYKVMDDRGNVINHVVTASSEQGSDEVETRNEKRRAEAMLKMTKWLATHFKGDNLEVVAFDAHTKKRAQ